MHTDTMRMVTCAVARNAGYPNTLELALTPPAWPDLLTRKRLRRMVAEMID